MDYTTKIFHWIEGEERKSQTGKWFEKYNSATGGVLIEVARGAGQEVAEAIRAAETAFPLWTATSVEKRAEILKKAANLLKDRKEEIAEIIALESGKPKKHAIGEAEAAAKCGLFLADQLSQFEPEKLISGIPNRELKLVRQSIGVGALITPFNNPMAGIAWKTFPALLCGNAVVVKAHEDVPYIPIWFGKILKEAGLPAGVFNVVQGLGSEVGRLLTEDPRVKFVSFTGSAATGAKILKATADRLAKVSIEAGGKNPLVVCDDADLEKAASVAVSAAFVDAGQRCAAASRIIVFEKVYDEFKKLFLEKVSKLKVGTGEGDDYGAIINERRMEEILKEINGAVSRGAALLAGGKRIYEKGYFIAPTVLENVDPKDQFSCKEIFGPVVALYKVKNLDEAIDLANKSEFRLSSAIHTRDMVRAEEFIKRHLTGVVRVNGPTYGSEPHVPFGGVGLSGNGWREPGIKSLDFYSDWKQVSVDL